MGIFEEVQKEFETLEVVFEKMKEAVEQREDLVEMAAKHPLYELEPYFSEHQNKPVDENTPLLILSEEDYNAEIDDFYLIKVHLESKKAYFRQQMFGPEVHYDTIFEYTDTHYKSVTLYQNPAVKKPIKLAYLYLNEGRPDVYVECTEYGMHTQKYKYQGDQIVGYERQIYGRSEVYDVDFNFNRQGQLQEIVQREASSNRTWLLFSRKPEEQTVEATLSDIEAGIIHEIGRQLQQNVQIEEAAYCVLLEYSMQSPFPPTIGIGVVSDLEDDEQTNWVAYVNAPDMKYFSEEDTLRIDLYTPELERAYLYFSQDFDLRSVDNKAYKEWEARVAQVYLNICKALSNMDFSGSFPVTDDFMILARDFEACNEQFFYQELKKSKPV